MIKPAQILICHHNDNDGYLAAAITKHALLDTADLFFFEGNFSELPRKDLLDRCSTIYVLDYVLPWEWMIAYRDKIVWIDHHEDRILHAGKIESQSGITFKGVTNITKCAALLTWEYFNPDTRAPEVVALVNDRDVWKWQLGEATAAFHEGSRAFISDYEKWRSLLQHNGEVYAVIDYGDKVLYHIRGVIDNIIKELAWEGKLWEHRVAFLNCPISISGELHRMLRTAYLKCDFVAIYSDLPKTDQTQVYMYRISPDIDLRDITAKFDGYYGKGRPAAAGFIIGSKKWQEIIGELRGNNSAISK
jgi:hypothetical protein